MNLIDPWSSALVDYEKLIQQFGIKPFQDVLGDIEDPSLLMRRGIIFGHRDFGRIVKALQEKTPFAVVTGMMPSGRMHIGHKMIVDQIIWYQKMGAEIYIPIADMEAYSARGVEFEESRKIALEEYITNYIALGLDFSSKNITTYLQSENQDVNHLAYQLGRRVNWNEMKAIYGFNGSTNLSHLYVPLIQVADILHPQLESYGGPKPTVVPVGRIRTPTYASPGILPSDSRTSSTSLLPPPLTIVLSPDSPVEKCPVAKQKQPYSCQTVQKRQRKS